MLVYFYSFYYYVKEYIDKIFNFRNSNTAVILSVDITDEDRKLLNEYELEIENLYKKIDVKYIYRCLRVVNSDFNEKTQLNKILDFLKIESEYISKNKENLNLEVNIIKKNTYIINLLEKFTILNDIKEKEKELQNFKKLLNQ